MANVIFDWIKRNWELYYDKKNIVYSGRCYFPRTVTCSTEASEIFAPIVNNFNPKIVCIVKSFFFSLPRYVVFVLVLLFFARVKKFMHCVLSIYHWWKKNRSRIYENSTDYYTASVQCHQFNDTELVITHWVSYLRQMCRAFASAIFCKRMRFLVLFRYVCSNICELFVIIFVDSFIHV